MAKQLRVCATLPEDLTFVISTHIWVLTSTYNTSSNTFFWPAQVLPHMWHTFAQTRTNKNKIIFLKNKRAKEKTEI